MTINNLKMGELKPIGSEKLNGDDKLKRILELTYYKSSNDSVKISEVIKESINGVYGIVKEKDGYYVKKGLNESSLDYIGGMFMKNKNKFSSYGEALKRLELLTSSEQLNEATKYVLKQPKPTPKEESPVPVPTNDAVPAPAPAPVDNSVPSDEPSLGNEVPGEDDEVSPETGEEDYLKVIQKLTGKLSQKLMTYKEKIESNDIKYVLNMVLSAVDLDKLEDTDREDILDKFEEEVDDTSNMDNTPDESTPTSDENELGETIGSLEELINTPFEDDDEVPYSEDPWNKDMEDMEVTDFNQEMTASKLEDDYDVNPTLKGSHDAIKSSKLHSKKGFSLSEEEPTGDETREFDINELTDMVNKSVKDSLSNYFK